MITVIDGPAGAGKTMFYSRLAFKEWKKGENIASNNNLFFDKYKPRKAKVGWIKRWFRLEETYNLTNCILLIDDCQILLDALQGMPAIFREKIAAHRHQGVEVITTTQDFLHIHWRLRSNVHQRFSCRSVFRFPFDEKKKPIFQICKYTKKFRKPDHEERRIIWVKEKRWLPRLMFISKFWTRTLYNTYSDLDLDRFLCKIIVKRKPGERKNKWRIKLFSRNIVNSGKRRL